MKANLMKAYLRGLAVLIGASIALPASAQTALTRTDLISLSNPSAAGAPVTLRAEIDALGNAAPTGWASFWDGTTRIGYAKVQAAGAGQATLALGYAHSCSLTSASGVQCWGNNSMGQLGDGTARNRRWPTDVPALTSVSAIVAGRAHTCALTSAGGVKCWGANDHGQLGDGTLTNRLVPVDVAGLHSGVIAIMAGLNHSCALTQGGAAKCWGNDSYGQLGDNTKARARKTPIDVTGLSSGVVAMSAGNSHTCALTNAGGVKCWGNGFRGQLGDGLPWTRLVPGDVPSLASGVVAISSGIAHTCALTNVGRVKCWGQGTYGQLGDGAWSEQHVPVDVLGLFRVVAIAAGNFNSCAITRDGVLKCWGENNAGQIGDGSSRRRNRPVDVSALAGSVAVSVGGSHICAIDAHGVNCWGLNSSGEIGDGTTDNQLTPVASHNVTPLRRSRAEFVTPPLAAGPHWLRAFYRGDATHDPSMGGWRQSVQ